MRLLLPPSPSTEPKSPALTIPLISPQPPRLSLEGEELEAIERGGIYSNYGPMNTLFEHELNDRMFGEGSCVTVCNATIGLMLAIREVIGENRPAQRRYALMPSFTFAATAQAALWCGLTPLLCDIDPATWLPNTEQIEQLLLEYKDQIAVIVPYATFGNNLDLALYERLSNVFCVPVVVDAAASLGSRDASGKAFGAGFRWPVVFSMHATKAFSVGEGGVIYCADNERTARLRSMGSFGFSGGRSAISLGLNAKLSEVAALTAHLHLREHDEQVAWRESLSARYAETLDSAFQTQEQCGQRQVRSFESLLLPSALVSRRSEFLNGLQARGIGAGTYFSPHLAEQPYFRKHAISADLSATEDIASRIVSLPLSPKLTHADIQLIAAEVNLQFESMLTSEAPERPEGQRLSFPERVGHSGDAVQAA